MATGKKRSDVRGMWKHGDGRRNTVVERTKGGTFTQFRHWIPTEVVKAFRANAAERGREQRDILIEALCAYLGPEAIAAQAVKPDA